MALARGQKQLRSGGVSAYKAAAVTRGWYRAQPAPPAARFMKIMRLQSWSGACAAVPCQHNMRRGKTHPRVHRPVRSPCVRRPQMQWETPSATDWRFGFEITLYVSAR